VSYDIPEYLRLHVAEDVQWLGETESDIELDCICQSFSLATGWQLDYHSHDGTETAVWSTQILDNRGEQSLTLELSSPLPKPRKGRARSNVASTPAAKALAKEIGQLIARVNRAERALWQREAELAAAVPVVTKLDEEPVRLAQRLEAILHGASELVGATAAALYILDDATTQLKLRAHWGLSDSRFTDPPRPLRTAKGDLEALAGQAVVLDDAAALPHWNIPEKYPSAVCIPVSTATIPLGTLWLFADQRRDFSVQETHILEIIAGRLAVELEREILLREHTQNKPNNHLADAVAWQSESRPQANPEVPGWDIAAEPSYENSLNTETHHWHIDSDGHFRFSLSSVTEPGITGSLTMAELSGLVRQSDLIADPLTLIHRVNQLLWCGSAGGRHASAFCAQLQPENGHLIAEAAGEMFAFIIRPHGWELMMAPIELLGTDEHPLVNSIDQVLYPGDSLLLLAGQRRSRTRCMIDAHSEAAKHAETLLRHNHLSAREMIRLVRAHWNASSSQWLAPPTTFVARYLDV
jgi:hypothetical protein